MKFTITTDEHEEAKMYMNARDMYNAIFEIRYNTLRSFRKGYWPERIEKMIGDDESKRELVEEVADIIINSVMEQLVDIGE